MRVHACVKLTTSNCNLKKFVYNNFGAIISLGTMYFSATFSPYSNVWPPYQLFEDVAAPLLSPLARAALATPTCASSGYAY